jgi:hypothetical protein
MIPLSHSASGSARKSGVAGALKFEIWSEERLPSSEGGACIAGTWPGSIDKAAGDTGIFGGGVGGTGELLCGFVSDGHRVVDGIVMDGYLFRLFVE